MDWNTYLLAIFGLGALFFGSVLAAFFWAARNGQFRDLEQGAHSIFTEEEPEGVVQDHFPPPRHRSPAAVPPGPAT